MPLKAHNQAKYVFRVRFYLIRDSGSLSFNDNATRNTTMARLKLKKRTSQIDNARPVVIKHGPHGPIWCESGDLTLNGDEKSELSEKLKRVPSKALVEKIGVSVMEQAASFFENELRHHVPSLALNAGDDAITQWLSEHDFAFIQDGLTSVVKRHGKVINTMRARIAARFDAPVKAWIESMRHAPTSPQNEDTST